VVDQKLSCSSAEFAELSQELLKLGSAMRFTAHGTSMHPLVRNGDVLLVLSTKARPIRIGDIILCRTDPENLLVHRVIRKKKSESGICFLIQGDQVDQPDGWIPLEQVFGRLVSIERTGNQFELDSNKMKILSFFAVLRSRWQAKDCKITHQFVALVKKIPIFNQYLE
jgi:signal peptidase I